MESGAGANDEYVPKLWYYTLLDFNGDQEEPRDHAAALAVRITMENLHRNITNVINRMLKLR